jgi:hypothetical protein
VDLSIELIDSLANFDYWPGMDSSIKCDSKIIFAENDEFGLVPDEYNLDRISSLHDASADVSYITLKGAGHLWPIKYPKRAAGYIRDMVNQGHD